MYLFARYVILKLPYSKNEKDFLKFIELINDGDHVLDIGANIGVMSYYLSKRLPNSAIHAFEPVPENMKVFLKVKRKFKLSNVKTYPIAVGNESGKIDMIMPQENAVYFHGLSRVNQDIQNNGKISTVEIKRLDELNDFKKVKVNALKIDVEEYEFNVLKGAEDLISKNRPVIYCELWDTENRKNSMEFIKKLDYKIFVNVNNKLTVFIEQEGIQNFFFIPNEYAYI